MRIAAKLGVSKSSVHRWVDGIMLTEDQLQRLVDTPGRRWNRSALAVGRRSEHRFRRRTWQQEGARLADSGNCLFREGCMLYWAEGTKSRHHVALSNSDPDLIRYFMRFLRSCFEVRNRDIRIQINCYDDERPVGEIEAFWLRVAELDRESLHKTIVNRRPRSSLASHRKLPYGVCLVRLCNTRIVQTIYGAIRSMAGIETERWID